MLSDGRILVADIGNNAGGDPNGQLTMFYPPYDPDPSRSDESLPFCKIDEQLATGQAIAVTPDDKVYLNSPRPSDVPAATAGGIWEYPGPFPTAPDAAGGCGKTDNLGSPMADSLAKTKVLASGENDLVSPSGLAHAPNGHWYIASVINGRINEYDQNWTFVQTVLQPPAGEELGAESFSTGTPLGLAVDGDGNLFFADIGIVFVEGKTPGPGTRTGSVNRITFTAGQAERAGGRGRQPPVPRRPRDLAAVEAQYAKSSPARAHGRAVEPAGGRRRDEGGAQTVATEADVGGERIGHRDVNDLVPIRCDTR